MGVYRLTARRKNVPKPRGQQRLFLGLIIGAILIWGAVHALGAYRLNHHIGRPVVVLACVGSFLGLWLLLMFRRSARTQRRRED